MDSGLIISRTLVESKSTAPCCESGYTTSVQDIIIEYPPSMLLEGCGEKGANNNTKCHPNK